MCAIVGLMDCGDEECLQRMVAVQTHRGPDDSGTWNTSTPDGTWVGLGSRRLSILDLSSAGHMPMVSADGRVAVVQNGEIYNYPALRADLETKGHRFRSNSDTEALLNLYLEYGRDCVHHLNGMFAFCIWDSRDETLFMGRDHFGIKPLYYSRQGSGLACASEIKALLEIPGLSRDIDRGALKQYLTFLWVPEPGTLFEQVEKLPAGHVGVFRAGELEITRYWDLEVPGADHSFAAGEEDLVAELRARFYQTVKAQMLSDAPIGAFLSAGLDSSGVVAAMSEFAEEPVKTFTISFPQKYVRGGVTLDDPAVARRTADRFGCRHTEIVVEPDVVSLLPKLVWHMDEPTADPAIITAFLVCQEARQHVKVLLSGVGGDEVFGGYRKYRGHFLAEQYRRVPRPLRAVSEAVAEALPAFRGSPLQGHVRLAKKMARAGSLPPREGFLAHSIYLNEAELAALAVSDWYGDVETMDPRSRHFECFDRVSHADFLNQMLYVDIKTFMLSLNLNYNDKMSMAASVEVRVPFLDKDLVEWVVGNVPSQMKLRGSTTKYLFRQALADVLPSEVLTQKKAGFGAPADYWLAHDLHEMTDDLLGEQQIQNRGLFRPEAVSMMLAEHRSGRRDWSYQIWQLLTLELWFQQFIDR